MPCVFPNKSLAFSSLCEQDTGIQPRGHVGLSAGFLFGFVRNNLRCYPQPWERGQFSFLSDQPGSPDSTLSELLCLPEPVPVLRVSQSECTCQRRPSTHRSRSAYVCSSVLQGLNQGAPVLGRHQDTRQRLQVLCKWSHLLKLAPNFFPERTISDLPDKGDQAMAELLSSRKSTNTLLLRAHSQDSCCGLAEPALRKAQVSNGSGLNADGCRPMLRPAASISLSAA